MHKATKIFLIAVAVFIVLFAGWYGLNQYGYNHPKITVYFLSSGDGEENVITVPQIDFKESSVLGASELWDDRFYEAYDIIDRMIAFAQSYSDHQPFNFDSRVEIVDDTTVFTIEGYYTEEDGERIETSQSYTLDYVLTKNIEEH